MITREQMQELKELGKSVKHKVIKDGLRIRVDSKCYTFSASNDQEGYQKVKGKLEKLREGKNE